MSDPAECDVASIKRMSRYLTDNPRCVTAYYWQEPPTELSGYSDSDWGGCLVTRRSTSGGCILHGGHLLQHWSRTQQVVSLSSAEAELHGLCKCASESLSVKNMTRELGMNLELRLRTDSSAARGIIQRQGCGKVKHLDVKCLWLQEREKCGDFQTLKIPRLANMSDLMTHHWSEPEAALHLGAMSVQRRL